MKKFLECIGRLFVLGISIFLLWCLWNYNAILEEQRLMRDAFKKNMEVSLNSGLGNQMFEYAAAFAYAKKHGKTLYISNSSSAMLGKVFPLSAQSSQESDEQFLYSKISTALQRKNKNLQYTCLVDNYAFQSDKYHDSKYITMKGYFQNPMNFQEFEKDIRKEFAFKRILPENIQKISEQIEHENSVCVHFRRGDYLYYKFYVLESDYYRSAVEYIKKHVENPSFYLFSNDIDWVKKNFHVDEPHMYVSDQTPKDDPYYDLHLMSQCKHFIIANSTYSWWGAWLSDYPEKIVVAPGEGAWFFNDPNKPDFAEDIVPKNWIKISIN